MPLFYQTFLFFCRVQRNCTQNVWVYDLRTNMPSFGKRTPFSPQHLQPFEDVYMYQSNNGKPFVRTLSKGYFPLVLEKLTPKGNFEKLTFYYHRSRVEGEWSFSDESTEKTLENSRWRVFSRAWIAENKGDSLDISWLKDSGSMNAEDLAEPSVLAGEAMAELQGAMAELEALMRAFGECESE